MRIAYQIEGSRLAQCGEGEGNILVYFGPTEAERRELVDLHGLDEHTLNSALDPDELPRIEFEEDHTVFIMKRPRPHSPRDKYLFKVASFGMFLFRGKIVLVAGEEVQFFEGKLFQKIASVSDLGLRIIYRSIWHFIDHLKVINMISESLEVKINSSMENRYLIDLFTLEKSLVYYLNAISGNGVVFERLKLNALRLGFESEQAEMLDDLVIENNQCFKQAEIYSNILSGMSDARASIVSNNLNVLMKNLNIITIAIMVPTLVVSAFSMNVNLPWGLAGSNAAFWVVMGLATISVVAFLMVWRTRKW